MKKHTGLLSIFISILFSLTTTGNNKINYYFKQINIEQGLSQSSVTSLMRDHRGILWIGTRSGLNSLDRNELKSYFNDKKNKKSLPGNYIYHIAEDSIGNIWISGNGGLAMYSYEKDEFTLITQEAIFTSALVDNGIIFGGKKVIYKYRYDTKQIENIFIKGIDDFNVSEDYDIIELHKTKENKVLVGTREKGLFLCDLPNKQINKLSFGTFPGLMSMYVDNDKYIYISVYKKGLYCIDHTGKQIAHYTTENSQLNNDIILDITEKDGNIWMATDGGGINILNKKNKSFSTIQHIPGDAASLPVNSITVLYKDRGNNLWAGSVRGGLLGIKETHINVYKDVTLGNTNGISEKVVISLFEDEEEILWIGTDGGGINAYNPLSGQFKHFTSTYGDKIASITDLSKSELLISVYGKGVFSFNKSTGVYKPFTIIDKATNARECFSGFLPLVHRVADDKIYILSQKAIIYNPIKKNFSYVKVDENKINPSAMYLTYTDKNSSFLIKKNQVFEIKQQDDSLRILFSLPPQEVINSACYDGKGIFWIGSNQGLSYFDINRNVQKRIDTNLFTNISNLFLDKNGKLWISAQNMLFSYIIDEKRFIIWGESDGFSSNEVLFMYQKPSITENIYLGGTNGLVKINKNISYDDATHPNIQLSDIILNGKSYLSKRDKNKILSVPSGYTSLEIKVNLNEKDVFQKTLFRYSIEGTNNLYIESYNHNLSLPLLPPGNYLIKVSCNTKSGEWTNPVTIVSLTVSPPWYKTSMFFSMALLCLIFLIIYISYTIIKKKERRLKWRMRAYEQTINEEKIHFLINISHELRTPLSLIYAPLKRLLDNNDAIKDNILKKQLSAIFRQAAQMKDIINMVLDINKSEAGLEALQMFPHTLNTWIKKIIEDFSTEFEERNIKIIYDLDNSVEQVWLDEAKSRIVLSNLLMNALKFSEPDTEITVSTINEGNNVKISIADQGIGLNNVDINKLFTRFYQGNHNKKGSGIGLSYAKKLIEKQGGTIGAYNNEQGATFFFELPLQPNMEIQNVSEIEQTIDEIASTQESSDSIFLTDSYSLLIVEDNADFRNFLKDSLSSIFKNVYTSENGRGAINKIEDKHPDIIVSDVMMPQMNGYELCRYVKSNIDISHIPVILLTARSDADSTYLGYKLGADSYLSKPFDVKVLIAVIRNLLKNKEAIKLKYKKSVDGLSPADITFSNADEEFMTKLKSLIDTNMSNPDLDVKFLTDNMAMSRASLYNKVKALTDMGVNDYINKLRIERAIFLLLKSDYGITEIAYETGFTYQRYFSTMFKQITGTTPSEYRRINR